MMPLNISVCLPTYFIQYKFEEQDILNINNYCRKTNGANGNYS